MRLCLMGPIANVAILTEEVSASLIQLVFKSQLMPTEASLTSASFFKTKLIFFLDILIQKTFLYIMKINNFRSDLTDISAKKEALSLTHLICSVYCIEY